MIDRDHATTGRTHGGSTWKLKDKHERRVATLDKHGKI